jgi:ATP-dependent phosphoenolpyruvate carboxykinase
MSIKDTYEYRRGFLDGQGFSGRMTGKTGRHILESLMEASEGASVLFISGSLHGSTEKYKKSLRVIEALGWSGFFIKYSNSNLTISFKDGGSIAFVAERYVDNVIRGNKFDYVTFDTGEES